MPSHYPHLQVAEICKKKGSQHVDVRPIDLSDMAAVDKFAEDVLQKYGCIDVLVNNAAILGPISYEGDATKNPNMGQGPIDGEALIHVQVTHHLPVPLVACFPK